MLRRHMESDVATVADSRVSADRMFVIVLKPISHPELGDIRIDDNLFAIGRTEPPFESYAPEVVADLSRRHARIFAEHGCVYIADLDSKNGTTVNGVNVQQKITRLQDGDEVCFGKALSYRVQLGAAVAAPQRAAKLASLTLTPESAELGLQPIVITQFPFLISKADAVFSRYKDAYPHQVNYISRRHAHIFIKSGTPFIEDLGSTNGTFVGGNRLEERAVPLDDGETLAFGGHHFVYKVSLQNDASETDPTVTRLASVKPGAAPVADVDKTTFVAAADSFLDIFCVDHAQKQDDEVNEEDAKQLDAAAKAPEKRRKRGGLSIFLSELTDAFAGKERTGIQHASRRAMAIVALVIVAAGAWYLVGSPERELKDLVADGDYARAATVADQAVQRSPDDPEIRALATEAVLKAYVPNWLALLKKRDFERAEGVLAHMKRLGRNNADLQSLTHDLEWMGSLEQFVTGRGGPDAPVRIYADEPMIKTLVMRWDEDTLAHQRAFTTMSAYVPEFRDPYAEALSHLRKLQSDNSVYLAAIERLKATIGTELGQDHPEALQPMLKEYAEKYPRLGLDSLRKDLQLYIDIDNEVRARRLGPLVRRLGSAKFATPPFQEKFRMLRASDRLPPADVIQKYQAASNAWRNGDTGQAFTGLQQIGAGPWAEPAAKELAQKKAVTEQFAALQKSHASKGYDERLLTFYGSLDPEEDSYFVRAVQSDVNQFKGKALDRAQALLSAAQERWRQYWQNGGIEGAQRLEAEISGKFRSQARLLSEAYDKAQQGGNIYKELKTAYPPEWEKTQHDIAAEMDAQRGALQSLRTVLEPGLLKKKLALLGAKSDGE
jgi:pSer/pThr/pTyr-binding forkhead associated (FHA) protein